ncbi:YraN family protein [Cohnella panacarvi]|uniref:YraN family protein n=1 Tax=Cohnella panacarvi TaxID=400776 RepID=UPI000478D90C|nr:YraN family protein [Cohnella panacarvi]
MDVRHQSSRSKPRRSTDNRAATGRMGEQAAADYLANLGYRIVARNWRCRIGEIDLIAEDGGTLVFVEVRARTNPTKFGTALEAVTPLKQRQVREVAAYYLAQRKSASPPSVRCDVVAVTFRLDGTIAELRHIPGAF